MGSLGRGLKSGAATPQDVIHKEKAPAEPGMAIMRAFLISFVIGCCGVGPLMPLAHSLPKKPLGQIRIGEPMPQVQHYPDAFQKHAAPVWLHTGSGLGRNF